MNKFFTLRVIPALIGVAVSGGAFAAAFQLSEQSASGIGVANAGAAATAEDASTVYFNPAGMTSLSEGHNFSLATTIMDRRTHFTNEGTGGLLNNAPPFGYGKPLGDDGGDAGGIHAIPALYYSYALTQDWRFGLAINPTFADETEYDSNFVGRYSGLKTKIRVININPTVAYKVNDQLSLALGIDFARTDIEFKQAVPTLPVGADGVGVLKGNANGWGYNFGLMYKITPKTQLGLSYRSRIKFDLDGEKKTSGAADRSITATLETPDTASLAINHQLNDKWTVLADYTWTGWSSLQQLSPVYADGSRAVAPLRYNFKDTYRVGLGATYQFNEQWKLRMGTAFDKNPIPNDESRTMTVPDGDRVWLALGARWTLSPKTSVDIGYAHVFVSDVHTSRAVKNTDESVTVQTVRGSFTNSADMISAQVNFAF